MGRTTCAAGQLVCRSHPGALSKRSLQVAVTMKPRLIDQIDREPLFPNILSDFNQVMAETPGRKT